MEGCCATLNLYIEAEIQRKFKAGYLFEGCYYGAIMGAPKSPRLKAYENNSYTVVRHAYIEVFNVLIYLFQLIWMPCSESTRTIPRRNRQAMMLDHHNDHRFKTLGYPVTKNVFQDLENFTMVKTTSEEIHVYELMKNVSRFYSFTMVQDDS